MHLLTEDVVATVIMLVLDMLYMYEWKKYNGVEDKNDDDSNKKYRYDNKNKK